jgi:hypothetical protein
MKAFFLGNTYPREIQWELPLILRMVPRVNWVLRKQCQVKKKFKACQQLMIDHINTFKNRFTKSAQVTKWDVNIGREDSNFPHNHLD